MERKIIIASHSQLAAGMKATLGFFTSDVSSVVAITAYEDNQPIDEVVAKLINQYSDDTELVIFTDVAFGSVNQQFAKYISRPHLHLLSGMNLPLIMAFALLTTDHYLESDEIERLVEEARQQLVYFNDQIAAMDDDDE